MLSRIEKQLKRRFAIGSQVSEHSIVQDFTKQVGLCWVWQGRGGEGALSPGPTHQHRCPVVLQKGRRGAAVARPKPGPVMPPLGTALAWGRAIFLSCEGEGTGGWGSGGATPRLFPALPSIHSPHSLAFVGWG